MVEPYDSVEARCQVDPSGHKPPLHHAHLSPQQQHGHRHSYSLQNPGSYYQHPDVAKAPGLGDSQGFHQGAFAPQNQRQHQLRTGAGSHHQRSLSDPAALGSQSSYLSASHPSPSYLTPPQEEQFPQSLQDSMESRGYYQPPLQYHQASQLPTVNDTGQIFDYRPSQQAGHAMTLGEGDQSQTTLPPLSYANPSQAFTTIPPNSYGNAAMHLPQLQLQSQGSLGQMDAIHPASGSRRQSISEHFHPTPSSSYPAQFASSPIPSGLTTSYSRPNPAFSGGSSIGPSLSYLPSQSISSAQSTSQLSASGSALQPSVAIAYSEHGIVTVLSAHPLAGPTASLVQVTIAIMQRHPPHNIRGFRVMFGHHGTTTRVVGESSLPEGGEKVELSAATPPIGLTTKYPNTAPPSVPLCLQALDEAGNVADWADIGTFTYTDSPVHASTSTFRSSSKRAGSPLSSSRDSPNSGSRPIFPDTPSQYPAESSLPRAHKRGHSRNSSLGSLVNGFGRLDHHSRNSSMTSLNSDTALSMASTSTNSDAAPLMLSLSPPGTADASSAAPEKLWIQTENGPRLVDRTPIGRVRAQNVANLPPTPSSGALRHPPIAPAQPDTPILYRTSQLPGSVTGEDGDTPAPNASRANLRFEGNLDYMAVGWSHEEWLAKRRLVQFWRRQEGSNIIANFRGVGLSDLSSDSIVISCIFREDKNECFVTSVDTIYLLEALVAVRFTVEEKNRIRRNMEGFKPITISKTKSDAEAFFKLIMSFPAPKPRNIEKDVKVFPWKMLGTALRKIISKYSASYLTGEELGVAGKAVPQPIGWAPGRTPPPQLPPAPAVSQVEDKGEGEVTPTPGTSGETQSSAIPASRAMSGRSMSSGASRPPPISLATVPEDPMQLQPPFQDVLTTPTK